MHVLVVLAHPLKESFAASVARTAVEALQARGHTTDLLDLYAEDFDPRLTADERARHMEPNYDISTVAPLVARLRAADGLIFVFPQWWFNLPAILKGYLDRVFAPGVAYEIDPGNGRLVPMLHNIRHFWALTTTGSPWWIVHFYMGNPVKRQLKRGVAAFCAKRLDFRMLSLHNMDHTTDKSRRRFLDKVRTLVGAL